MRCEKNHLEISAGGFATKVNNDDKFWEDVRLRSDLMQTHSEIHQKEIPKTKMSDILKVLYPIIQGTRNTSMAPSA
ncbi:MAG: hypothetical protein DLM72_14895 [Candidatus Nitrosopolaris wilkensis]|nr:MAG: hypothetical protein DLM72_14895 [Candidatus Nitrosopolaris wilkensis]